MRGSMTMPGILGITESRRLVGDYVLRKEDGDVRFADAIAQTGHWTRRNVVYDIPYRCLTTSVSRQPPRGRALHLHHQICAPGHERDPSLDGNWRSGWSRLQRLQRRHPMRLRAVILPGRRHPTSEPLTWRRSGATCRRGERSSGREVRTKLRCKPTRAPDERDDSETPTNRRLWRSTTTNDRLGYAQVGGTVTNGDQPRPTRRSRLITRRSEVQIRPRHGSGL